MDLAETVIELTMVDSLQEKCQKLNVEAELEASVFTGMVKLGGSGTYLADEQKSARAHSMSLIYKLKTTNEEVMLTQNKHLIDKEILSDTNPDATHVVVGIDWGAQCTITCEYENTENDDVTKVKGEMKAELGKFKVLLDTKGKATVDLEDSGKTKKKMFTFKCRADVKASDKDLPITFEGAVDLARSLPSLVEKTNDGKGVPVTYYLMPLENVRKKCRVQTAIEMAYKQIDESTVRRSTGILEKVKVKCRKLYDIHHDMHLYNEFISDEALVRIDEAWVEVTNQESRFKKDLQEVLKSVRSGKVPVSDLEDILEKIKLEDISTSKYEKEFDTYVMKIEMIEFMISKGIKCIGKKNQLVKDAQKQVFILYVVKDGDREAIEKNHDFFMRLFSTFHGNESCEFIVVDQEVVSHNVWPDKIKKVTIEKYVNGTRTSDDLYDDEGQYLEECMVQVMNPDPKYALPRELTILKLRCPNSFPGNGGCPNIELQWKCSKCKQCMRYGTTSKLLYCTCGKANPYVCKFRCNDPQHGMNFMQYPKDYLGDGLSSLKLTEELNVLILGETGVGKSTWINGIQNYLSYTNLNEAMIAQDFPVLIPSSFVFSQDGEAKKIKVGIDDPNEVQEEGKSSTKKTQSYIFYVGDRQVRLIDTPGIGDTGGIEQDVKNMNNILSYLSYYSEIHAICILLKPNNSRLTAMFRFCIQELLVQLHSSAKHNIVFCFTNARQTFYQPGDTLPILNTELRNKNIGIQATKDNYFCFDNEPFRFLACIKNGVKFSEEDISTYSSSWERSVKETKRLFNYIDFELKPHNLQETLGLNEARRIIIAMSKPLAEVAHTITYNLEAAREAKSTIGMANAEIDSLKGDLNFTGFSLRREELGFPRTVCAAPECIKYVPVGETRVQNTVYEQICHDHCYLDNVPIETTNNTQLRGCATMSGGNCTKSKCKHSYKHHMHITYDLTVKPEKFLSPKIQSEINKIRDKKEKKKEYVNQINKKVAELEEEQKIIMKTGAKFGSFLNANALIPYNDAVGDYLDMCIKQERAKPAETRNENVLETMRNMKSEYTQQREILDNAIGEGASENIKTPEQVKVLQEELFKLKHFGAILKTLFREISFDNSASHMQFQEKMVPPLKAAGRRKGRRSDNAENVDKTRCTLL
nr:uncharacterized protein LOC129259735 [Lytechinus pictus]